MCNPRNLFLNVLLIGLLICSVGYSQSIIQKYRDNSKLPLNGSVLMTGDLIGTGTNVSTTTTTNAIISTATINNLYCQNGYFYNVVVTTISQAIVFSTSGYFNNIQATTSTFPSLIANATAPISNLIASATNNINLSGWSGVSADTFTVNGQIVLQDGTIIRSTATFGSSGSSGVGDNLGNHIATMSVNMSGYNINNIGNGSFSGTVFSSGTVSAYFGSTVTMQGLNCNGDIYAKYINGNNVVVASIPTSAGIQEAIDQATVLFPANPVILLCCTSYTLSSAITIRNDNTKLIGLGMYSTLLDASGWSQNAHAINCSSKVNLELTGFHIKGKTSVGSYDLINSVGSYGKCTYLWCDTAPQFGIYANGATVTFSNCFVYNCQYGIQFGNRGYCGNCYFEYCTYDILLPAGNSGMYINNNMFYQSNQGIYLNSAYDVNIVGNVFTYNHSTYCIAFLGAHDVNIVGNSFIDTPNQGFACIDFQDFPRGSVPTNNSIKNNNFCLASGGIGVKIHSGTAIFPQSNVTVEGNKFFCDGAYPSTGVYCDNTSSNTTIRFNEFKGLSVNIYDNGYNTQIIQQNENGNLGIGTFNPTAKMQILGNLVVNGNIYGDISQSTGSIIISNSNPPATTSDTGTQGEIRWGGSNGTYYVYIGTGTNGWARATLSPW